MNSTPDTASWGVILPAAGQSIRFGGTTGKLLSDLNGRPVVRRSIEAFLVRADVAWIGLAIRPDDEAMRAVIESMHDPRLHVCAGGDSRAASVRQALLRMPETLEWVGVHDAARPMISQALIDRVLQSAREHGAAGPALPVTSTIKQADGPLPARVISTLPREQLRAMQTPQIMRRADLAAAYERCPIPLEKVTDDLQLLELAGFPAWLVEGDPRNIKITTRDDLRWAAV